MRILPGEVPGLWPLLVQSVDIDCGNGKTSIFAVAKSEAYPINGAAYAHPEDYQGGYPIGDTKTIIRRDPKLARYGDLLIDTGPLVRVAIKKCRAIGKSEL